MEPGDTKSWYVMSPQPFKAPTYTVDVVGGGRKAADMVHKSHNDMEQFALLNV